MARNRIKREILIHAGVVAVRARLLDMPIADRIWQALPIYATVETRQGLLAFAVSLQGVVPGEDATVAQGAFAVDAEGSTVLIPCGPMYAPIRGRVWAFALDDVGPLADLQCGDRVALLEADS